MNPLISCSLCDRILQDFKHLLLNFATCICWLHSVWADNWYHFIIQYGNVTVSCYVSVEEPLYVMIDRAGLAESNYWSSKRALNFLTCVVAMCVVLLHSVSANKWYHGIKIWVLYHVCTYPPILINNTVFWLISWYSNCKSLKYQHVIRKIHNVLFVFLCVSVLLA